MILLLAGAGRAQQPFATDDTDVTPRGQFHFEFSNEYDLLQRSAAPNLRQNTADFELDYGLLPRVEIGIEAPLLTIFNAPDPALARRVTGLGDTNLSVKYNFYEEREGSKLPAFAVSLNVEVPTGDTSRQLGSGLADVWLNGIMQKSVTAKTKWRANGGVLFSGNTTTGVVGIKSRGFVMTGATSLVKQFTPRLDLGAEVTGAVSRNLRLSKGQLQFLVGGNYKLRRNLTFDFAVLGGRFSASPRLGGQLGFSLDF